MMLCDAVTAPLQLDRLRLTSRTTPLLIRGLVPEPLEAAASALAAANGTEVRLDLTPLAAASSPFKLANGSLVRPAQVAHLPLGRVLELMRAPDRPYRAYVRYLGSEEAPVLADALRLRPLGALWDAHHLRQHVRAFNVWLGDGSMRSALHYDGFDNVLLQLAGSKRLILYPPASAASLGYAPREEYQWQLRPGTDLAGTDIGGTEIAGMDLAGTSIASAPLDYSDGGGAPRTGRALASGPGIDAASKSKISYGGTGGAKAASGARLVVGGASLNSADVVGSGLEPAPVHSADGGAARLDPASFKSMDGGVVGLDAIFLGYAPTGGVPVENHANLDPFLFWPGSPPSGATTGADLNPEPGVAAGAGGNNRGGAPGGFARGGDVEEAWVGEGGGLGTASGVGGITCVVGEGDGLFLPALWSHAVESSPHGGTSGDAGSAAAGSFESGAPAPSHPSVATPTADGSSPPHTTPTAPSVLSGLNLAVNVWFINPSVASVAAATAAAPDWPEAHFVFADHAGLLGRPEAAVDSYRRALSLRPTYYDAQHNLAAQLSAMGDTRGALAAYDAAILLRPTEARPRSNRGLLLRREGRLDEAEACYRGAVAVAPADARAWGGLGHTLALQGDSSLDEAARAFQAAVELAPREAGLLNSYGVVLEQLGRRPEARGVYERAVAADPAHAKARQNLAAMEGTGEREAGRRVGTEEERGMGQREGRGGGEGAGGERGDASHIGEGPRGAAGKAGDANSGDVAVRESRVAASRLAAKAEL